MTGVGDGTKTSPGGSSLGLVEAHLLLADDRGHLDGRKARLSLAAAVADVYQAVSAPLGCQEPICIPALHLHKHRCDRLGTPAATRSFHQGGARLILCPHEPPLLPCTPVLAGHTPALALTEPLQWREGGERHVRKEEEEEEEEEEQQQQQQRRRGAGSRTGRTRYCLSRSFAQACAS